MAIRDLITPDFIRQTYALGVDLTLDDGSPYPDVIFEQAIDAAVAYLEANLGISLDEFTVKGERHDARTADKNAFYPLRVDHRPLRKVNRIAITYGNYDAVEMPDGWAVVTSPYEGQFNLIPTAETIGSFFFRAGLPLIFGDVFSPYSYVPAYFSVDYAAGPYYEELSVSIPQGVTEVTVPFTESIQGDKPTISIEVIDAQGGSGARVTSKASDECVISLRTAPSTGPMILNVVVHTYDPLVVKAVGLISAIAILDIAGDLIAGAGIANFSVGVDGLSQSLATTASATSAGYGARIISYRDALKETMAALKAKYRVINIFSI